MASESAYSGTDSVEVVIVDKHAGNSTANRCGVKLKYKIWNIGGWSVRTHGRDRGLGWMI